jgi:hypothetical protein
MTGVIFWMQLIKHVLAVPRHLWQVYWHAKATRHRASLIFYQGAMSSDKFVNVWTSLPSALEESVDILSSEKNIDNFQFPSTGWNIHMSLFELLLRWGCKIE